MIFIALLLVPVNHMAEEGLSRGDSSKPEPLTERQKKDVRNAREEIEELLGSVRLRPRKRWRFAGESSAG